MISVIVPVYKSVKYINKCIDSILGQEYTEFELLLTDDGSPDGSPQVCDEYALNDERIVVVHKQNGGASEARNYALDCVTGDYISFVDSDDYIDCQMYAKMIQVVTDTNTDLCICGVESVDESGKHLDYTPEFRKNVVDSIELWTMYFDEIKGGFISPCNKLFCRNIWGTLRFPTGKRYEDDFVFQSIIDNSAKISFINEPFYKYSVNEESTTHTQKGVNVLDYCECQFLRADYFWGLNQTYFASRSVVLGILALIDANVYFKFYDLKEQNKNKEMILLATEMAKKVSIKNLKTKNKLQILISRLSVKLLFLPYKIAKR